ncbi:carbohydrate ABC transporter permease [Mycoplasma marinum]|uniref:ABC transmembrane type-1 domain-containing protein n=1 Tax=Mycoplasma marinum TaxID=1937190 RepID=A0A4R0XMI2_9MOLU|nr:sugar ABC transporter permease [Mycoplasma marinum]TCG11919.1 hypothetical protein C4B24_00790 [Mycoplasma marinum]
MNRTLVNGLGQAKESRTLGNSPISEQKFLWKHNFKKIDNLRIKKEISIYKDNAEKSKATNTNYKIWKKGNLKLKKLYFNAFHKVEGELVSKGVLTIAHVGDDVIKNISSSDAKKKISEFTNKFNLVNEKLEVISNELVALLLIQTKNYETNELEIHKNKISQIKLDINNIVEEFKAYANGFCKDFISIQSVKLDESSKVITDREILKSLKKSLKENGENIKTEIMKSMDEFQENKNLNWLDKLILKPRKNAKRMAKSNIVKDTLKDNITTSYETEYQYNQSLVYLKYENELIAQKLTFSKELNKLIEEKNTIKEQGFNKEKYKNKKAEIAKMKKEAWNAKKIEMKAGSSSKRAKTVEKKSIFNHYAIMQRDAKIELNPKFKIKNAIGALRSKIKNDLKFQTEVRENELKDVLRKTPVETSIIKYWIGIIAGTIFPGLGTLIIGKKVKGALQLMGTLLVIIILMWIFGAFPSSSGNGLFGLSSLGYDPKTATSNSIGMSGGTPNDGRFYLVTGTLAIIMLGTIIMYWIISILDNINQLNAARIGMRPSNWKEQKKLLKTQGLPYLLSLPAMIFIIFIVLLPLMATILISFTDFGQKTWEPATKSWTTSNGVTNKINWVGGEQFKLIFTVMGPEVKSVLLWTIIWTVGATLTLLIIGTFFALVVNQNRIKFKNVFRIIYILPWAVPAFITILYFSIFFSQDGVFNELFGSNIRWAHSGSKTKILMIFMQGWLGHSYIFLLVTGMLQSIPKSLYEASRIDGASSFRQFRTITAPIIVSKIAPLLIGQFVFNFNNFGLIYLFNGGGDVIGAGTAGQQDIFISWIYKLVSGTDSRPGAAAAMSLFISVFTVTPSAFMFVRSKAFKGGR